jgi:MtN3 and saliva related transmembrane protein
MMERWVAELIGCLAGSCTTISLLPQLLRIWRAKSARDVSLTMFTIFGMGIFLWLIYGIGVGSPAVIATNAASLLLAIAILVLSVRYQHGR